MKTSIKIFILLFFGVVLFTSTATADEYRWKFCCRSDGDHIFYDSESIIQVSENVLRVWLWELDEKDLVAIIKQYRFPYSLKVEDLEPWLEEMKLLSPILEPIIPSLSLSPEEIERREESFNELMQHRDFECFKSSYLAMLQEQIDSLRQKIAQFEERLPSLTEEQKQQYEIAKQVLAYRMEQVETMRKAPVTEELRSFVLKQLKFVAEPDGTYRMMTEEEYLANFGTKELGEYKQHLKQHLEKYLAECIAQALKRKMERINRIQERLAETRKLIAKKHLRFLEMDCKERTLTGLQVIEYDSEGNIIKDIKDNYKMVIPPGSLGEMIINTICKKQ